jgi:hypothetical protein
MNYETIFKTPAAAAAGQKILKTCLYNTVKILREEDIKNAIERNEREAEERFNAPLEDSSNFENEIKENNEMEKMKNILGENVLLCMFRDKQTLESTIGRIVMDINGKNKSFYTLEDVYRKKKIAGITRIPAGTYKLIIQDTLTPKTMEYRRKYPFFHNHIQLQNVKDFTNVYIHVGNYSENSEGCILIGKEYNFNQELQRYELQRSSEAYKEFYSFIFPALNNNANVTLKIFDEEEYT